MFYVKTKINEGTYFTTEITDESAYIRRKRAGG